MTISLIVLVNSHHKQTTSNDQRELRFSLHSPTGTLVYTPSVFCFSENHEQTIQTVRAQG